jgi:hypothetical protein
MRLKTVVSCPGVSMPGQTKDPTRVDSSLQWTPYLQQKSNRVTMPCNDDDNHYISECLKISGAYNVTMKSGHSVIGIGYSRVGVPNLIVCHIALDCQMNWWYIYM